MRGGDDQMLCSEGRKGAAPALAAWPTPGVLSFTQEHLNAMIQKAINNGPAAMVLAGRGGARRRSRLRRRTQTRMPSDSRDLLLVCKNCSK